MMGTSRRIFMVAGEASGDRYGSMLVAALRGADSQIEFEGIGGLQMRGAGVKLFADSRELAVVGLTEVLSHWKPIHKAYRDAVSQMQESRPHLLLLIDYPDFNLRLAKEGRRLGIPVVYFISPQVWAWRKSRIQVIAQRVDKMLVILPFEEALYREAGVPVEFVGHPLLDIAPMPVDPRQAKARIGVDPEERVVGLLPGSRRREIESHLPRMLASADLLRRKVGNLRCVIPVASTLRPSDLRPFLDAASLLPDPVLVEGKLWDALNAMDAAMVKSGTATLEAALMGVPMVIVYRTSTITYSLAKLMAEINHVGLVNIVAGRRLVPERVQREFTAEGVANLMAEYLTSRERNEQLRAQLLALRESLGRHGCFQRAATAILGVLNEGSGPPESAVR
jgi:lipid-A-disaccharide synthase